MKPVKRLKRSAALTMRMTQAIRDQLDLEAARSQMSVSTMAEHCIREGLFMMAFKRRMLEEDAGLPTPEEVSEAQRVMRLVAERMQPAQEASDAISLPRRRLTWPGFE